MNENSQYLKIPSNWSGLQAMHAWSHRPDVAGWHAYTVSRNSSAVCPSLTFRGVTIYMRFREPWIYLDKTWPMESYMKKIDWFHPVSIFWKYSITIHIMSILKQQQIGRVASLPTRCVIHVVSHPIHKIRYPMALHFSIISSIVARDVYRYLHMYVQGISRSMQKHTWGKDGITLYQRQICRVDPVIHASSHGNDTHGILWTCFGGWYCRSCESKLWLSWIYKRRFSRCLLPNRYLCSILCI